MAEDVGEADLGAGLLVELGAPPRLWRRRIGGLPLVDVANGGGPTVSEVAVEAPEAPP